MSGNKVAFFTPYDFTMGQKIRITEGSRHGDWQVIGVSDKKVTLKCPVSGREFEWSRFCYLVEEQENVEWPAKD
ncbi:MAG: hypothetical protein KKE17_11790 [Proteobacteria bacterium]|nr:hypothetical protein [Pseudomonadota bacterium]MBU1710677.1 hypothetical protein [Pseudomonadota bacterium]